jgi:hypothetical protein
MKKLYISKGARSLTFMLAGKSPATLGERAALQLSLPPPACDFREPPAPEGPGRPAGDGR